MNDTFKENAKKIAATAVTVITLGLGAYLGLDFSSAKETGSNSKPDSCELISQTKKLQTAKRLYDHSKFAKLQIGMDIIAVFSILDSNGVEVRRNADSVTIVWINNDGTTIKALFVNNILTSLTHTLDGDFS